MRRIGLLAASALGCAVLFGNSRAAAQSCGVATTATAFGTYSPASMVPTDTTGTISVTCQATLQVLVSYTLALSAGQGGSFGSRTLQSGSNALGYQLYTNPLRTAVWGDGTAGTSTVSGGTLLAVLVPSKQVQMAYGRIPARQNVSPGTYLDTVVVTVWW